MPRPNQTQTSSIDKEQTHLDDLGIKHEEKIKSLTEFLNEVVNEPVESLIIVDTIQRLGVESLFREQIKAILRWQYTHFSSLNHGKDDVYEIALRFRLLRQEGYYVPAAVFERFNDKINGFVEGNIKGMMELYEASQMSIEGEDILDKAEDFSSKFLNALLTCDLDHEQARMIESTLRYPYRKSIARSLAPQIFVDDMPATSSWMEDLLEVANRERRIVQSVHQKEIHLINEWWKELGLGAETKFARDQPLKWYMWSMAILTDPSFSELRVELIKPISLVYVIDDVFDVHGTIDELILFTEVIGRWDNAGAEQLPEYMKVCFKALGDITDDFGNIIFKKHGWNPTGFLKQMWANLCNAFLVEFQWNASGKLPNADDYLKNGTITSGVPLVLAHLFFLTGQDIANQSMDSKKEEVPLPNAVFLVAQILRLWDDLGCAQDENQNGYDGSYVECYLRENHGCSHQSAREHVMELISKLWKQLNKECLSPCPFSAPFHEACVNAAKMVSLMYNYEDKHGLGLLQEHMKSLTCDHATP
ncbi:(3S,6E)-nerolidol synthase 1-like [Rhodamnia argentea]|uniref:(3S,6E)-nerolidol synthase 1-like n=1 Tax=Rhodamnia argentea TaxID=178133 RepID=A0A8B8N9N8_9MYRT|nr:(3S,6E)-nerolidol synthase 1-like [Rhodamnia argentea]